MKRSIARGLSVWATLLLCLLFLTAAGASAADKRDVIKEARTSYYSLQTQGLAGFQCNLTPNWDALLEDTKKTDPKAADRAISMLRQLQFTVSLGTTGSAKVTHTTIAATDDKMAEGLNQIYSGMEQMVSGFFDTWSPFMISSPFPEAGSNYELADEGDLWNLSYKDGASTGVVTTMTKSLVIRELKVNTPQFSSSIRPQFTNSAQGLLLTGYQADYLGQSPSETTHLQVGIAYQTVNGFQIPQKMDLGGSYGGSPFQVEVTFSGCQASKR
jgi:hypothetical protein